MGQQGILFHLGVFSAQDLECCEAALVDVLHL